MRKENIMTKTCLGCGITLQTTDINQVGYIPENKYDDSLYCQRCFKLIHYAKKEVNKPNINNKELLDIINKSNSYAFFLVDLYNLNSEIIDTFNQIKIPKTLLINKSDLIPRGVKLFYLKENIQRVYNIKSDVIFISTKKDIGKNTFINPLINNHTDTAYILGYTNAGKSSLINKLLTNKVITTSNMPNTTLDLINLKLDDYNIIDTPGFTLSKTFYQEDDWDLIKRINASHTVKPLTYQTKENQIFMIEEKIFLKNFDENSITFYLSNLVKLKKLYKEDKLSYKEVFVPANSDVVITNIGFINIKASCHMMINKDALSLIEVRPSLFGGE